VRSAIICHAAEDDATVGAVSDFLESNCSLTVSRTEGLVRPGFDLVDAAELGLSADVVLVALSPASVPAAWRRERWEPIFRNQPGELGTSVVILLLRACRFPELLRRENFFDLSRDRLLAGQRALKRWFFAMQSPSQTVVDLPPVSIRGPLRNFEELRRRIADCPGMEAGLTAEDALAFAHECKDDFEGVFWIDCTRRSRAGVLGDIGHALGLRLPGSEEQNRTTLCDWCANRRCLFILDRLREEDRNLAEFEGKASVIFSRSEIPDPRAIDEIMALFTSWPRNAGGCLRALGDAHYWLTSAPADDLRMQLGYATTALLRNFDRFAEACEILNLMENTANERGDLLAAHRLSWEQSAIRERWGEPVAVPQPISLPDAVQLPLEF
jgi:hypothetical protein